MSTSRSYYQREYPSYSYSNHAQHQQSPYGASTTTSRSYSSHPMVHDSSHSSSEPYGSPCGPSPASSPRDEYNYNPFANSDIEFDIAPPISTSSRLKPNSKPKPSRRSCSSTSPPLPPSFPCLVSGCDYQSGRAFDLKRHMNKHNRPPLEERHPCPYHWCKRQGERAFDREDHKKEHLRKVHMIDIPKRGGGRERGERGVGGGV